MPDENETTPLTAAVRVVEAGPEAPAEEAAPLEQPKTDEPKAKEPKNKPDAVRVVEAGLVEVGGRRLRLVVGDVYTGGEAAALWKSAKAYVVPAE